MTGNEDAALLFEEVKVLESLLVELVGGESGSGVDLSVVLAALEVVGAEDLAFVTAQDVLHEDDVVGALDLVSVEGEESVDSGEQAARVASEVLVEERQVALEEVELVLSDGLEDVAVVGGEEEELSAAAALTLNQVEHLAGVPVKLEGGRNRLEAITFKHQLEDLRGVNLHGAFQHSQLRNQGQT